MEVLEDGGDGVRFLDVSEDVAAATAPTAEDVFEVDAPDQGGPVCVQRRLARSAGVRPAGVAARSPVAWIAGRREIDDLKPIDKAVLAR
jgi:hypothetical protein